MEIHIVEIICRLHPSNHGLYIHGPTAQALEWLEKWLTSTQQVVLSTCLLITFSTMDSIYWVIPRAQTSSQCMSILKVLYWYLLPRWLYHSSFNYVPSNQTIAITWNQCKSVFLVTSHCGGETVPSSHHCWTQKLDPGQNWECFQ